MFKKQETLVTNSKIGKNTLLIIKTAQKYLQIVKHKTFKYWGKGTEIILHNIGIKA